MKKLLLSTTLSLALVSGIPSVTTANFGSHAFAGLIHTFDAQSVKEGNYPTLTVWPGSGLTLNFTRLKESVKQVWLDDPSKVTLDYAGELCSSPCNGGVQVLHLKRVNGLNFPNLPSTAKTTLTVVTVSHQGENIYKFFVTYGLGNPQYLAVNLTPPAKPKLSPAIEPLPRRAFGEPNQERIALLERGLAVARAELDQTTKNRFVLTRAELFLEDLKRGYPEEKARQRNHLSPNAVATLASFGSSDLQEDTTNEPNENE